MVQLESNDEKAEVFRVLAADCHRRALYLLPFRRIVV
jgi:hypothetical protein